MFEKWLQNNDLSQIVLSNRLFPPASDREFWSACLDAREIRTAEEYLNYQWPLIRGSAFMQFHDRGDRLAQEKPYFARRKALLRLLLGELTEYKGRFLPELCDGVFLVCEETFWGLSAHLRAGNIGTQLPTAEKQYIDLYASETAEFMVVFRHLFADTLASYCPELLARIDYELERRIIKPYLEHTDFWWMGYGRKVNNWNPWILSNVLTVFLLNVSDRKVLEIGIRKMFTELDHYYLHMPDDGGCDEGPGYWDVAGGRVFAFCDRLYVLSGGKIDFFGDEKLKKILLYPVHAHISGFRFANFSDGSSRIMDDNDYIFYVNGLRTGQSRLCALASAMKMAQAAEKPYHMRRMGALCAELYGRIYARDIDAYPQAVCDDFAVLPQTQAAYIRRGSWYCATKGGNNAESHNHNDVGSFMVYRDGKPVLIDPGCGVYRKETFVPSQRYSIWTMQSAWHNLPTLNGVMERDGAQFCAESFRAAETSVEISFAGAYPAEAGVRVLQRQLTLEETGLTFRDGFVFESDSNVVEENFMTALTPAVEENTVVLGGRYRLRASIPCAVELDRKIIADDPKLFADWQVESLWRLRFSLECGKACHVEFTLEEL